MGQDTPEQARLRAAVRHWRKTITKDTDPFNELLAAAEAMLPKVEAWADFSECEVFPTIEPNCVRLDSAGSLDFKVYYGGYATADRAQAIRAAVLLKHSKRLMEAPNRDELMQALNEMNAEAERIIREAGK